MYDREITNIIIDVKITKLVDAASNLKPSKACFEVLIRVSKKGSINGNPNIATIPKLLSVFKAIEDTIPNTLENPIAPITNVSKNKGVFASCIISDPINKE